MERGKRYQIIKRHEREAIEKNAQGINVVGINDEMSGAELLSTRSRHESPLARSSPVNEHGVQLQQGRCDLCTDERQKSSSSLRNPKRRK